MASDDLGPVLEHAGVKATQLHRAELNIIGRTVTKVRPEEFIEACTYAPGLSWDDGQSRPPGTFEIHGHDWWIDVSDPANREYLLVIIVAAALADTLRPNLPVTVRWIAQVMPGVLTPQSVHTDNAGPHVNLVRLADPQIPAELTDDVNQQDFTEFVAAVDAAPAVLPLPAGGAITVTR